ncbi:MAG: serine/threonine protein kinase [Gammaproteobacteria bacterium]|nr:serine/threonine protein kinase [Gammaproteobacteria bacterium]
MKVMLIGAAPESARRIQGRLSECFGAVDVMCRRSDTYDDPKLVSACVGFDLIMVCDELDACSDRLVWIDILSAQDGCPPLVYAPARGDEYLAVAAIKHGATEYINQRDLDSERFADVIGRAIAERAPLDFAIDSPHPDPTPAGPPGDGTRDTKRSDAQFTGREHGLGAYRLLRQIGAGAMSRVFLAERCEDRRSVAVKLIDAQALGNDEIRRRFINEAKLTRSLHSPFVVEILDHGSTPDHDYLVMELFTRGDLKQRVGHGIADNEVVPYLANIAYGLQVIHAAGIVHRDLKPENIMFRSDDSLALADFGVSKFMGEASLATTVGTILGTPHYMSPEQGRGDRVDHRADLYACGIILYEMLTGRRPYEARRPLELIHMHVTAPIPRLPYALRGYQSLLNRLLAKDPAGRIQSAEALAEELRSLWACSEA